MRYVFIASVSAACLAVAGARTFAASENYDGEQTALANVVEKVELSEALALAERHVRGGSVVDAGLKVRDGHDAWDVEMERSGEKLHVWIDASTGEVQVQAPKPD